MDMVNIVVRWLHISGAVIAVGGAVFARFVVLPSLQSLPEELRPAIHESIRKRYARLVMLAIAALVIGGFYNYLRNEMPAHKGQPLYHSLMGAKILLAFVVFLLAGALTGRSPAFENIRRKRRFYLSLNVLLGLAIIALGAVLRTMPDVAGR